MGSGQTRLRKLKIMFNKLGKKISSLFKGSNESRDQSKDDKIAQQESLERMRSGAFTLDDFEQQMGMMDKIGSISKVMRFMPGMQGMKISPQMVEQMKVEMKKFRSIIKAMTPYERLNPHLLTPARKSEIALQAGVQVADIAHLLKRFEESKQLLKQYQKNGRF